jgi:DNA replication and repair protein RecF
MILKRLNLLNFKNYAESSMDFDSGVNIFTGLNGQGKTNLLDAIHYLSLCKSYFNPVDKQNIRHGEEFFVVEGEIEKDDQVDKLYCGVQKGKKKVFRRNKEEYEKLADHIGRYPSVVISPYDKDLISEGSDVRRKFIDGIVSQFNRSYLDALIQYNRVLKQRNALLKYFWENRVFQPENLEVWDEQLVEHAEKIHEVRSDFIRAFNPLFTEHYQAISGGEEEAGIEYVSHVTDTNFKAILDSSLDKDRRTQYTNVGVHKDDLQFLINGYPLKKFGSQGQQKTFLISLKLAQYDLLKAYTGTAPILLLDDIFDKIDDERVKHLMNLVSQHNFGQIFITDTHADRIAGIFSDFGEKIKVFTVKKGSVDG